MIYDFFNFLTGYVYIKIEGSRLEQLLNSSVTFWNVSRNGYGCIYANVSMMAYYRLCKDKSVKITLVYERGLFAMIKAMWKNKVLLFGMTLVFAALIVLSQMVLRVEVRGYYSHSQEEIQAYVEEWGFAPFRFKGSYDLDSLTSFLRNKDNIAWASAGYDGVVLSVVIIEQRNIDDNTPCDILADRQAVIEKIDVYSGIRNKQIGDIVSAGDLLVTGIQQTGEGIERIKARADVIGTIWEQGEAAIPAQNMVVEETGQTVTETYLDFWGNKAFITKGDNSFTHFVSTKEEKHLGGQYGILPIKYVTNEYREANLSHQDGDMQGIMNKAGVLAFENTVQKVPTNAKIVSVDTKYNIENQQVVAQVVIEAQVPIGVIAPVE